MAKHRLFDAKRNRQYHTMIRIGRLWRVWPHASLEMETFAFRWEGVSNANQSC